jgi:hypothetical protein
LNTLRELRTQFEAYSLDAKLEVSLEKVRHKTMTMNDSHDVAQTVALMFEEMLGLGVKTIRCGIGIMKDNMQMEIWTSNAEAKEKAELIVGFFDMTMHPMFVQARNSWEKEEEHFLYDLSGDDLIAYYTAVNNMPGYKTKYNLETVPKFLSHNSFQFSEGTLFVFSLEHLTNEMLHICQRFSAVFGQTYRRYLDLVNSEEQKRIVEEKHKEILDSIHYAKRIQSALMPTQKHIERVLNRGLDFKI